MDAKKFFEDMLSEGREMLRQGQEAADQAAQYAAEKMGADAEDPNHETYKNVAKGGALAGALALGLGTRAGGTLLRVGALSAIGALAYRAYTKSSDGADEAVPETAQGPEADRRARALLSAMIAGARADGEVDARDRSLIETRLQDLGNDAQSFFMDELMKPIDPSRIAAEAQSPQESREIYAAAALICGQSTAERAFLDALASALDLPHAQTAAIEAEAGAQNA